ncbi:helix-turn-helix domain-containing protein [Streptomyces ehimensis]|uniref:Helix-turn-helix domain-containing protein n=1 Tax=Streptomyces ehimensis TaxID=68195 RepID=A0ABV9BMR6_9ACTN
MPYNPQRPLPRGALSAIGRAQNTGAVALPHLYRPAEVAEALGCSEWWVKEQARRRRIPFTRVGGSYRFTAAHFVELVAVFEERPLWGLGSVPRSLPEPAVVPARQNETAPKVQLRPKPPRRASGPSSVPAAA